MRNPQFPLCLSKLPRNASQMNMSQKNDFSMLRSIHCCSMMAASMSSSSVPYPFSLVWTHVFFSEPKSANLNPPSVKSLQAMTVFITPRLSTNLPSRVSWAFMPIPRSIWQQICSEMQLLAYSPSALDLALGGNFNMY